MRQEKETGNGDYVCRKITEDRLTSFILHI